MKITKMLPAVLLISGCAASTGVVGTTILPTSNKSIDVVIHRSDIKFLDCSTLAVIQTYGQEGKLIDAKSAQGRALHCEAIQAGIQAAGTVGAGAFIGSGIARGGTKINNNNEQGQGQYQGQGQIQGQSNTNVNKTDVDVTNVNVNSNTATGGMGGNSCHGNCAPQGD
jgi:hypothetical protein